ncbi:MAG: hypothetical protein PHD67_09460 [Oscillospiraceae bacterium]|nr:hypothetical protein [Oscillospiraceae bacterium]
MKVKTGRGHSLFKKIILPLILVLVCQSVIFFCATAYGGVSATLNQNAENVLTERVINQKNDLENKFNNQWSDFSTTSGAIRQI